MKRNEVIQLVNINLRKIEKLIRDANAYLDYYKSNLSESRIKEVQDSIHLFQRIHKCVSRELRKFEEEHRGGGK